MCGRYALFGPSSRHAREISERCFAGLLDLHLQPRYNIAPDQGSPSREPMPVPIIRAGEHGLEAAFAQWWLLPRWSKERYVKFSTFNARIGCR